ncbi:MAG: DUF4873 domain-containing protein [Mycobacteriales bacterium]|jgi:hypothetical protein
MTADTYQGPATLVAGEVRLDVRVALGGQFDPLAGGYRWFGRVDGPAGVIAEVATLLRAGQREVTLAIGERAATGTLREVDAWGGCRITGGGAPPFR